MGIFDFIKKIFEENKSEKIEKEKIDFSEIGNWIDKKRKKIKVREEKVFTLIQDRMNVFVTELKEKATIVENLDLKLKKAEDRLESASEEGRKKYLESLESFIDNLDKLEKDSLEKFSQKIDKVFLDFNKSSNTNYQKATILIGKEMTEVKETLKTFSTDIIRIFEENKDIVDSLKIFSLIELKLNEITKIDEETEKIKKALVQLDKDLLDKEEEKKKILTEIEEIKKSENYLENLARQDKIKLLKEELEKDFFGLRQTIDFKALANFYHIFEEKMKSIKEYKEDFQKRFEKDDGETALNSLLDESKLNNENISNKIKNIKEKKQEITETENKIEKDKTDDLYSKSTKIILDIDNLNTEKAGQQKKSERLNSVKEELVKNIKEKIELVGGVVL